MDKVVLSLILLIAGVLTGYVFQRSVNGLNLLKIPLPKLQGGIQKIVILVLSPISFVGAIWIAPLRNIRIVAFPVLGVTALLFGGFTAWGLSKILHMKNRQAGAFIICGGFTNLGSIGAFVVFLLLGEAAFALASFYKLFESFIYYGIGFPLASSYAGVKDSGGFRRMQKLLKDPFILVSLTSIILGFILNYSGLERPDWYGRLNTFLVPFGTFLLLVTIGMALRFGRMRPHIRSGLLIMLIKFVIIPIFITTLAYLAGLGRIENGLPLKVVMVLSSMPVGLVAMVPPTLYGLDVDLSNTAWMMTTSGLLVTIPLLWLLLQILPF